MFSSNNLTLKNLINFADEKENLLGGEDFTKQKIKEILSDNDVDAEPVYEKDDLMIIEVWSPMAIKQLGCNSLWCFTYSREGSFNWGDWNNYSTNGVVYLIVDFSNSSDSTEFMHVLIRPLKDYYPEGGDYEETDVLFDMANQYQEDPNNVISYYLDFNEAKKIMNFGIEEEEEEEEEEEYDEYGNVIPKPEPEVVDPNQLSLDLRESIKLIKNILREKLFSIKK